MSKAPSKKSAQRGVVLIEAMLAIVIFSIGVLAIVGLQAAMIKNVDESKYRAEASYIAQKRIGEMWANPSPSSLAAYVETDTDIGNLLPGGKRTVAAGAASGEYQVTVKWTRPGAQEHQFTTTAIIGEN